MYVYVAYNLKYKYRENKDTRSNKGIKIAEQADNWIEMMQY